MLTIINLNKKFQQGHQVLFDIHTQIEQGEFIALLGASGSGKSTLLECLSLKQPWTEGKYLVDDKDILEANLLERYKFRKKWAFLHEQLDLKPKSNALRNVLAARPKSLLRTITRTSSEEQYTYGMDFLDKVGLLDHAHLKVEKMSGGEKQRVGIARALIKGATYIAADDPTRGLDPHASLQIMQDFKDICEREKVTVLCAFNQIELAEQFASRIWIISQGRLALDIKARRLTMREKEWIE